MAWKVNRAERRIMKRMALKHSLTLQKIPRESWPAIAQASKVKEVWQSAGFVVQIQDELDGVERMSVNRSLLNAEGEWEDGITWDEMQEIKRQCGRGDKCAIEIFPPDVSEVNDHNIRHLWVLKDPPPFMWGLGRKIVRT